MQRIPATTLPLAAFTTLAGFAAPLAAQGSDSPYATFQMLKPKLALSMAQAAMSACRDGGYRFAVTVADRFGLPQVYLRDRFAGAHVFETARRMAWTAVSFRTSTAGPEAAARSGEPSAGIHHVPDALPLSGGRMVLNGDGTLVAGIGVSGAPGGSLDEDCAKAGIAAIEDEIAF
jgi:uncharacterized protein GlcG (DUF336 family)